MFTSRAETCVTFSPGTDRIKSANDCDGEFWSVWLPMTVIVDGAFTSFCSTFDAVTTTTSSYFGGSSGFGCSDGFCRSAGAGWAAGGGCCAAAEDTATATTNASTHAGTRTTVI